MNQHFLRTNILLKKIQSCSNYYFLLVYLMRTAGLYTCLKMNMYLITNWIFNLKWIPFGSHITSTFWSSVISTKSSSRNSGKNSFTSILVFRFRKTQQLLQNNLPSLVLGWSSHQKFLMTLSSQRAKSVLHSHLLDPLACKQLAIFFLDIFCILWFMNLFFILLLPFSLYLQGVLSIFFSHWFQRIHHYLWVNSSTDTK